MYEIEIRGERYRVKVPKLPNIGSQKFKTWFGDSKVVGNDGQPLVVYHGSARQEVEFRSDRGYGMGGIYFTPDLDEAIDFAINDVVDEEDAPFVSFVYLAIRNPKILAGGTDSQEFSLEQKAQWEAEGYDGVIGLKSDRSIGEVAAFRLDQLHIAGQPAVKTVEREVDVEAEKMVIEDSREVPRGVGR